MAEDLDPIRYIGDMQRLQPQAGDVFVLTTEQPMAEEQAKRIHAKWVSVMGADVKLLLIHGGLRLGVISRPAA